MIETQSTVPPSNRLRGYVLACAIIAALGGLLFGFDTAVISGAEGTLREIHDADYAIIGAFFGRPREVLTREQEAAGLEGVAEQDLPYIQRKAFWHGFLVAAALLGTIIGAIVFGKPADRYGRRTILFVLGALYFISAVGSALAWSMLAFMGFRFIGGLAVGGASVVSPMYVAEISPARFRGRLVALVQFNIVLEILLAYLSNFMIGQLDLDKLTVEWRWMFAVEAIPALAFALLLSITPHSPRWLVARNRMDEAKRVLGKVGTDLETVEQEVDAIRGSLESQQQSIQDPFFCRKYMKPIMLAVTIAAFNQLSGINALIYYTKRIFEMAGQGELAALGSSVGIGFVNLVFTMAALSIIDHFGRKKLMLVGSIGYILSLGTTAWAFYTNVGGVIVLLSLIVFIASHAFGQGAVIWVFIGEIFPNRVRARGQALGSFTHWIMAALISLTFPVIAEVSGAHVFAFYCVCMVGQLLWVIFLMPETKGVPLEEIQEKLGIK
ncbi:MAG: sugar porter family MFS transporter [Planctomycetota bacterium]